MERTTPGGSGGDQPPRRPRSSRPPSAAARSRAAQQRAERRREIELARFRRSILLVLASVVVPGSAQFVTGNRRVGKVAAGVWFGVVGVVALIIWQVSMTDLARWAVRPAVLTSFNVLAIALAVGWIAIIVDAWRLGHPPGLARQHRLTMLGVTIAVSALVATPFVMASQKVTAAHDAVVAMFPSGEVAAASNGRLNILLLGADAGEGRIGVRPDSIMLASIDVQTGEPALISLPRNLEEARFPSGTPAAEKFPTGFSGDGDASEYMLNATWTYGEANPDMFPGPSGPGPTAVKQAVQGTLGVQVHYYVAVDLDGFKEIIDALGGVTIRVQDDLVMGESGKILEAGLQELDGSHALWYARSRTGSSDYARMSRQRCVIGAVANEADPSTVVANFEDLAAASESMVTTDIPREDLSNLVDLGLKAKSQDLPSLQFVPPLITSADPDIGLIRDRTQEFLHGGANATSTPDESDGGDDGDEGGDEGDDSREEESVEAAVASEDSEDSGESASTGSQDSTDDDEGDPSEPVDVDSVCSYE